MPAWLAFTMAGLAAAIGYSWGWLSRDGADQREMALLRQTVDGLTGARQIAETDIAREIAIWTAAEGDLTDALAASIALEQFKKEMGI